MISFVEGHVRFVNDDEVVVFANGVGYGVVCHSWLLDSVSIDQEIGLHIYSHFREDGLTLFGFSNVKEKHLFLNLIKVNGIGPRMAVAILSAASMSHLVQWICSGSVKELSKLPKIGKKKAEQMVLTLKDKLKDFGENADVSIPSSSKRNEIIFALSHLGFKNSEIEKVIDQIPNDLEVTEGVKRGLALLTSS